MNSLELLAESYGRISDVVHEAVDGLDEDGLAHRADESANSIAWLVWHLARVQDDHVAGVAGSEQIWHSNGWNKRFGLPFDDAEIGYGQSSHQVADVRASAELLSGYFDDVHRRSLEFIAGLGEDDLDRVVDEAWDPPVTMAVRLVSVLSDDLQHAGQAAFVRGLVQRR